jgi:hypothetical protein
MAIFVGQRDEIAFGIDHDLLHQGALCSSSRRSRCDLPEPRIALHQQAGGQQFLEVEHVAVASLPASITTRSSCGTISARS